MKNICIGIDISKETFDVTLIFVKNMAEFNSCGYSQFDNAPHGFRSLVAWVRKIIKPLRGTTDDCLFCMETTGGYDLRLCNYLYEHKFHVWREMLCKYAAPPASTRQERQGRLAQHSQLRRKEPGPAAGV